MKHRTVLILLAVLLATNLALAGGHEEHAVAMLLYVIAAILSTSVLALVFSLIYRHGRKPLFLILAWLFTIISIIIGLLLIALGNTTGSGFIIILLSIPLIMGILSLYLLRKPFPTQTTKPEQPGAGEMPQG